MLLYTHIFKKNDEDLYISEGHCCKTVDEANEWLDDYYYGFQNADYSYYCTYEEDTKCNTINKLNLL